VWLETGMSFREGEPLQARVNLGHPCRRAGLGRRS
jgi:hypothetical protein